MWQSKNDALYKEFTFENFDKAFDFMGAVAKVAKRLDHHPKWSNEWNKVQIWLSTHDTGSKVTKKDEELASEIDQIYSKLTSAPSKAKTSYSDLKIYTDGGSRGNPGPAASGYVLFDSQGGIVEKKGKYLGITTNNQAEYQALKQAIEAAQKHGAKKLNIFMDSLLIVNQIKGIFKVKNEALGPIYVEIKHLLASFEEVNFTHIPRELNKIADGEVNLALDNAATK